MARIMKIQTTRVRRGLKMLVAAKRINELNLGRRDDAVPALLSRIWRERIPPGATAVQSPQGRYLASQSAKRHCNAVVSLLCCCTQESEGEGQSYLRQHGGRPVIRTNSSSRRPSASRALTWRVNAAWIAVK